MGAIQTILYENSIKDLYSASAHYSMAEYEDALPHLLRRLPLLEASYREDKIIRAGLFLLSRVYLKCLKYHEALENLKEYTLTDEHQSLYVMLLIKNKEYEKATKLEVSPKNQPQSIIFSTLMQSAALLLNEEFEEALSAVRSIFTRYEPQELSHWILFRAFIFELEDLTPRLSSEAEEASILIRKELTSHISSHWYSSRELPAEWKEELIDYVTGYFAPEQWEYNEKVHNKMFPEPVELEYEWALDKLLANIDAIPASEVSRTLSYQF